MPSLFHSPTVPPSLSKCVCGASGSASGCTACPIDSTICHLSGSGRIAASPFHPGCPSPPLLPVWMNVSFLSPWLSYFHVVRVSLSSGCFLFLNCHCPSFGCARRCRVSTYATILAQPSKAIFISLSQKSFYWTIGRVS